MADTWMTALTSLIQGFSSITWQSAIMIADRLYLIISGCWQEDRASSISTNWIWYSAGQPTTGWIRCQLHFSGRHTGNP